MRLCDSLLWALDNVNGVSIYCDDSIKEEVKTKFIDIWSGLMPDADDDFYSVDCDDEDFDDEDFDDGGLSEKRQLEIQENKNIIKNNITDTDYGFRCLVGNLVAERNHPYCNPRDGISSFKSALKMLKDKFPSIKYFAYAGFSWHDEHSGDVENDEFNSENIDTSDMTYDFVGECLKTSEIDFENEFIVSRITGFTVSDDEIINVLESFRAYDKYISPQKYSSLLKLAINVERMDVIHSASDKITADNIDELIELAQENKFTECTAFLLDYKNKNIGFQTSGISAEDL